MKCPICVKSTLFELKVESEDYKRGYTHKCMVCQKFLTIIAEDF